MSIISNDLNNNKLLIDYFSYEFCYTFTTILIDNYHIDFPKLKRNLHYNSSMSMKQKTNHTEFNIFYTSFY